MARTPARSAVHSDAMWEAISARGRPIRFAAGHVIVRQGELGDHCYAIRSGEVLVTAAGSSGATVVLGVRGRGEVVGKMAALDGGRRSATVTARTPIEAVVLSAAALEALLLEDPRLALDELRRLSGQLRSLSARYALRGEEVRTRIVELLRVHAGETGSAEFRSTRAELAGWVGATREAVSRALADLESAGVVELGRGTVVLVETAPPPHRRA